MGDEYLAYFHEFIRSQLAADNSTFTAKEMVLWVQGKSNKTSKNIIEHLLKRTKNYPCRDNNKPRSKPEDDLFVLDEIDGIEVISKLLKAAKTLGSSSI